ncbi:MAG: hypothetical protein KY439_08325 [Actinobacteria bacterium]|nr:hypothetical protein [Actinomycetota bacterium]
MALLLRSSRLSAVARPRLPSRQAIEEWAGARQPALQPRLAAVVAVLLAFGSVVGRTSPVMFSPSDAIAAPAVAAGSPRAVVAGSSIPGRAGAEQSARMLVGTMGGLPLGKPALGRWVSAGPASSTPDTCPAEQLVVSWSPPVGEFAQGAYVRPLGPPPTAATRQVNGIVTCAGSTFAYVGFEGVWDGLRWTLTAVPSLVEEGGGDQLLAGEAQARGPAVGGSGGPPPGVDLPGHDRWAGIPLEPLAVYEPQAGCDPEAKPGVLGFRDLLLARYPGSRNMGIGRPCELPGVSEHKEGRAFNWGLNAYDPSERAAADEVLGWLFAPDEAGNPYALARRLGIMYIIWDGRIWSSFLAEEGWRPFSGVQDHTDHIHFSFNWAGARGETSFWKASLAFRLGSTVPDLPFTRFGDLRVPVPLRPLPAGPPRAPARPPAPAPVVRQAPAPAREPAREVDREPDEPESRGDDSSPPPEPPPPSSTAPPPTTTTTRPSPLPPPPPPPVPIG